MQKLVFGVPAYKGQVCDALIDTGIGLRMFCALSELAAQAKQTKVPAERLVLPSAQPLFWQWLGRARAHSCNVAWSRNRLLAMALKLRADWLLMCDADCHTQNVEGVFRMLQSGYVQNAAAIAAPVQCRDEKPEPVWNAWLTRDGQKLQIGRGVDPQSIESEVIEAAQVGAAFLGVNCNWIRERWRWDAGRPWFAFQDLGDQEPENFLSEDLWFCDGVRERGGRILLDGRLNVIHEM